MDRRDFLRLSLLASAAASGVGRGVAGNVPPLRLTLRPNRPGSAVAEDFTGLSYETAQLGDPGFFSPDNAQLAGFHRRLGGGVLRIGGNTSAYGAWTPSGEAAAGDESPAATVPDEAVGPDTGKAPEVRRPVTPLAIRNLSGFLDLTGWRLIYGLNIGGESPEAVADEAEYVMTTMGSKLAAFQLGNEPDLFARNGVRKPGYDFARFAAEWLRYRGAVRRRAPHAPFAGPDTARGSEWLAPFARRFGKDVLFLSQHYYAEGPPADPSMTVERLLRPDPRLDEAFAGMARTRRDSGLPLRTTEANSCYRGGKPGVSDVFAAALWGAELMYRLAAAGGAGVNFHGGGYGWYTPIAGTPKNGFLARPLYYGMLLFAEAGAGTLVEADIDKPADAPLLTCYGLKSAAGALKAALFNKDAQRDAVLAIDPGRRAASASVLRLSAPRLDDAADTTLGGAPVGAGGAWSPAADEKIAARDGTLTLHLPKASAALVTFG